MCCIKMLLLSSKAKGGAKTVKGNVIVYCSEVVKLSKGCYLVTSLTVSFIHGIIHVPRGNV